MALIDRYQVTEGQTGGIVRQINFILARLAERVTALFAVRDYSEAETEIGVWIDGKMLYRKVVDIGALPDTTSKDVSHGISISGSGYITRIYGVAYRTSPSKSYIPLPYQYPVLSSSRISLSATDTVISVRTATNYTDHTGYVILEYTK
jgi:hypothetical protein